MYFFDMDGTLTDSNGVWKTVDREFLARRGLPYTHAYYEGVAHTILPLAAKFTREFCRLPESCEEIMAEWMELAKDAYRSVPLKPYVREYLERCRSAGHRMAIFTACVPEHCRTALACHRLEPYFERIIYAQELGVDKKSPEIFQKAAALLGVRPKDCVLFDDSLSACRGAKAAGMTVVGVQDLVFQNAEPDMRELCDQYITGFQELL